VVFRTIRGVGEGGIAREIKIAGDYFKISPAIL